MIKNLHILVVDDNKNNATLIADTLEDKGYQVSFICDSRLVIDLCLKNQYDLILLDVMMPFLNGFDLCKRLKELESIKDVPIIFLTALNDMDSLARGFELGAVDYIRKPFKQVELLARVDTHLSLKQTRETLVQELRERRKAEQALKESENRYRKLWQDLGERLKELRCLYHLSELLEHKDLDTKTILQKTCNILPPAWKYPKDACARIQYKGETYRSAGFEESPYKQASPLIVYTKQEGTVEVFYTKVHPTADEGPFLSEERKLIDAVAERLGHSLEQQIAEVALKENQHRLNAYFEHSLHAILIIDFNGKYVEVNPAACKLFGYSREEFLEIGVMDLVVQNEKTNFKAANQQFIEQGHLSGEMQLKRKDGQIIDVEFRSVANIAKGLHMAAMHDITERKQFQRQILKTIIETEEKERSRFAKDLHDGLGATLSSINIYLNLLELNKLDRKDIPEVIQAAKALINDAIVSSKEIANNMRPNVLTNFGLVATLKSFCQKLDDTKVIQTHLTANNFKHKLNEANEITLFRIINELINNTLKHGQAKNIYIKLQNTAQITTLKYKDDGVGFNVDHEFNKKNYLSTGLRSILTRVHSVNGHCRFKSEANKGMEALIQIKTD